MIADELEALASELHDDMKNAETAGGRSRIMRVLELAADLAERAAELVLELDPGEDLPADVRALAVLCANCGHDRGDHLVEAPHACECAVEWFGLPAGRAPSRSCTCPCFCPRPMPDLMVGPTLAEAIEESRRPA